MTTADWHLNGDFLELCNCEVACPCVMVGNDATPTEGFCDGGFIWHIEHGEFDGVALDGLNFAFLHHAPGRMSEGNWTAAVYVDERSDERQREALVEILSGKHGGPMENYMALTGNFLGIKYVPIDYKIDRRTRSVSIPAILDFSVEGLMKPAFEAPIRLENIRGWVPWMSLARGTKGTYADHGLHFENTGRNGFCGPFQWPRA